MLIKYPASVTMAFIIRFQTATDSSVLHYVQKICGPHNQPSVQRLQGSFAAVALWSECGGNESLSSGIHVHNTGNCTSTPCRHLRDVAGSLAHGKLGSWQLKLINRSYMISIKQTTNKYSWRRCSLILTQHFSFMSLGPNLSSPFTLFSHEIYSQIQFFYIIKLKYPRNSINQHSIRHMGV
jgi:hypothetical protein